MGISTIQKCPPDPGTAERSTRAAAGRIESFTLSAEWRIHVVVVVVFGFYLLRALAFIVRLNGLGSAGRPIISMPVSNYGDDKYSIISNNWNGWVISMHQRKRQPLTWLQCDVVASILYSMLLLRIDARKLHYSLENTAFAKKCISMNFVTKQIRFRSPLPERRKSVKFSRQTNL